ncbi:hypothetical protein JAAARDRAFT_35255 [Jaapia argillacea MUCL 33604]|uniref:Translation initiation factor eIF2B subunit gamma n=1 Tax=Jaapia argillacea MUCL 33604 TaxID=933084 RepID=A0A067PUK3_9AGAM|nr:hypothetical protein JAAARDRAFT_35255 [Jaapia argillacea MUCL 33604]
MDFEVSHSQPNVREFLAVILSGFGNELVPLSSDHGDEPCPKALLPIANKPMLDYPLAWLEQSGVKDVLLICPTSHRSAISHYIHSDTSSAIATLRINLQTFDESQDLNSGTSAVLKHFSHLIQQDFILLPCDFIPPPSLPLNRILNKFRTESVSDGCLATTCWFEAQRPDKAGPEEWGPSSPAVPIVWDEQTGTLLHIDTPDDADRNVEELDLRMSLLNWYPRTKLSTKFQDSHVYVCRRSVLDALGQKHHLESFREEFIPWLCKLQYQSTKREKYGGVVANSSNTASQSMALHHSTSQVVDDITHPVASSSPLNDKDISLSIPPSPTGHETDLLVQASLRVGVVLHKATAGYAARANTLHTFLELNRHFLSKTTYTPPTDPKDRALLDPKIQISSDSIVGDSTRIEERTTIKRSVIGNHCIIGKMVKITGCVLQDHCVLADGAKLDGCILGKNTKIGAKAELSRCVTQAGYEVDAGESLKNEKLDVSDWTAHSDDGADGESDEEEQEEESDESGDTD